MKGSAAKSALRTFAILEHFRKVRQPLRLRDIAASLQYPPSSTAELLKAASESGYLNFDPVSRTYFPVARFAALGDWIVDELYDRGKLIASMKAIHAIDGDGVILALVNGLTVEYVEVLPPAANVHYDVTPGALRPLIHSGSGWASLCDETDELIEKIYRRSCAQRLIDRNLIKLEDVEKRIRTTRADRFAVTQDIVFKNTVGISMALPKRHHGRRLALLVNGPTGKLERNFYRIVDALHTAATATP
jgi:DNA-binding IclR family transcriptional regulator